MHEILMKESKRSSSPGRVFEERVHNGSKIKFSMAGPETDFVCTCWSMFFGNGSGFFFGMNVIAACCCVLSFQIMLSHDVTSRY